MAEQSNQAVQPIEVQPAQAVQPSPAEALNQVINTFKQISFRLCVVEMRMMNSMSAIDRRRNQVNIVYYTIIIWLCIVSSII